MLGAAGGSWTLESLKAELETHVGEKLAPISGRFDQGFLSHELPWFDQ